jgi:pimeloyl-ACP methyl ester carboxylesterase
VGRPSFLWLLSEPSRALLEIGASYPFSSLFAKTNKTGDGHPVMVIPGFMGSDTSTVILRKFIKNLGYDTYDWGLGRNVGKVEYLELLLERLDEIYQKTGKSVSLVGWSLGGVFARQLAKKRPDIIRQVITLGSPFAGLTEPNNASWAYTLITGGKKVKEINDIFLANVPLPAPVPTTAIYTKEDGIVQWQTCMEKTEDRLHQNIQVHGSHIGLGANPSVLSIIADRLRFGKNNWSKFEPTGLLNNKILYPSL